MAFAKRTTSGLATPSAESATSQLRLPTFAVATSNAGSSSSWSTRNGGGPAPSSTNTGFGALADALATSDAAADALDGAPADALATGWPRCAFLRARTRKGICATPTRQRPTPNQRSACAARGGGGASGTLGSGDG